MERLKNFLTLRSISSKLVLWFAICGLLLLAGIQFIVSDAVKVRELEMVAQKEETDIQYLNDYISDGEWHIADNTLCKGNVKIGDGTEANANTTPFVELEEKTGTFYYTFILKKYVAPEIRDDIDSRIPVQTEYIRAAGSTRNAAGESIVGTYMDKAVSDELLANDVYSGVANVEGRSIFCLYKNLKDENGNIVGSIVVGRSVEEIQEHTREVNNRIFFAVVLSVFLAAVVMMAVIERWISALNKARDYLQKIGTGIFPEEPLEIQTKDEMAQMAHSINSMTESLKEKERIGMELSLATDIQSHMLPSIFPPFPGYDEVDIFATMDPAKEVGGDFYDFFMLDEKHIAVVIADVSGKGVPAALFMVIAKTLIKNHAQSGASPAEVFTKVNQMLCEGNDVGLFVTAWMGVLNTETCVLTFVNAGHNPPLLKKADGGFEFLKTRPGFVLAGMEGFRYKQNEIYMKPGERLFLYTDGVTEATNLSKELYGEDRLVRYLNSHCDSGVKEILLELREDINNFANEAEQFDDITMLILDFKQAFAQTNMKEREFEATDEALQSAMDFVEEELDKLNCPPKTKMQIAVCVEEIFVNIAHYAYSESSGKMKLGILPEEGGVSIRFSDRGMPFNPLSMSDPDITLSAEERQIGGLGFFMVKKTMDDVQYKFENGQNILTIKKKF